MKLTAIARSLEQRVVVYGPPKSGKTEMVGRLAERYKLLWFDLENGSVTLSKLPLAMQENIELIKIRDSAVYPIAVETMMKVIRGEEVNICVNHSKVKCPICSKEPSALIERVCLKELGPEWIVVIDSGTQFSNSAIAHITRNQNDEYKMQFDDWGNLKTIIEKFLSQVQVAPYNLVYITHEEEVEFEDGRKKIVPVSGSSKSSRNTAKYFDHVVYCNVVNKKHVVGSATDYSMSILTGSRTDVKLEASKEPSLLDIFTTWKLDNYGRVSHAQTEQLETATQPQGTVGSGVQGTNGNTSGNTGSSGNSSSNSGNSSSANPGSAMGAAVDNTPAAKAASNLADRLKSLHKK